jgi:hypothetical protein
MTTFMLAIMSLRIHQQQIVVGDISSGLSILTAGSNFFYIHVSVHRDKFPYNKETGSGWNW